MDDQGMAFLANWGELREALAHGIARQSQRYAALLQKRRRAVVRAWVNVQ